MKKKKCFVHNNQIYFTYLDSAVPDGNYIEVDENVTIDQLKIVDGKIKFKTKKELLMEKKEQLKNEILTKFQVLVKEKLNKEGYLDLGDLLFYVQKKDEEALNLLKWYELFDAKIWNFIENELSNKNIEEIENFDIEKFIKDIAENIND